MMRLLFSVLIALPIATASAQPSPPSTDKAAPQKGAPDKGAAERGSTEKGSTEKGSPKDKPSLAERANDLEFLFGALKAAPDATAAKHIEDRIMRLWAQSQSDTAALLMSRVRTAVEAKDTELALSLLDAIVEIRPDYFEAWSRRATLHFARKDFGRAIADIQQVLAREPRHFGALAGLGMMLQEMGDEKRALDIFRHTLTLHPHMERLPELVKQLTEKVEGRDI